MTNTYPNPPLFQCCKCGEWTSDCIADNYRAGGEEDWCKQCRDPEDQDDD